MRHANIIITTVVLLLGAIACGDADYETEEAETNGAVGGSTATGNEVSNGDGNGDGDGEGLSGTEEDPDVITTDPDIAPNAFGVGITSNGADLGVVCTESVNTLFDSQSDFCGVDSTAGNCSDSNPPLLGHPQFLIDGVVVPQLDAIPADGQITLLIPYEDPECDLSCGQTRETLMGNGIRGSGSVDLPGELPCGSGESGRCLSASVFLDTSAPGQYVFNFEVSDACQRWSDPLEVVFNY